MNLEEQKQAFDDFTSIMRSTLLKKGNDYSGEDRLSNFKLAGNITGIGAEMNCLNLIATKVARLGILLRSKNMPDNESTSDSLLDLANYSILLWMLINEKPQQLKLKLDE